MHDHVGPEAHERAADGPVCVSDVGPQEFQPGRVGHRSEVLQIARVGQRVEDEHLVQLVPGDGCAHEGGADETRAAGDQDPHLRCVSQS